MAIKKKPPLLVGQKIKGVRPMTPEEGDAQGWTFGMDGPPMVIELWSGATVFPSRDPEGNGAGCLFAVTHTGEQVYVEPEP